MIFTQSLTCTSRVHCSACRDASAHGRSFRESLATVYALPVIDFDCPHGVPWGAASQPMSGLASRPGWGQRLATLFAWLGIRKRKGCGCAKRAAWIDRHGPIAAAVVAALLLFGVLL